MHDIGKNGSVHSILGIKYTENEFWDWFNSYNLKHKVNKKESVLIWYNEWSEDREWIKINIRSVGAVLDRVNAESRVSGV